MSVELSVRVTAPVRPEDAVEEIELTLQELLNLSWRPTVHTQGTAAQWTVAIPEVAEVAVLVLDLPYGESLRETGATAVVSAGGFRTAGSVALMIAVAIALARTAGGRILDESRLLTMTRESEPASLLAELRLSNEHGDLSSAANDLYRSLHGQ